jgi:hypothetical protein
MTFINTISLGEAIVGGGTLILAFIAFIVTAWQIKEARRSRNREIDRQYKHELLDKFETWIREVIRVLNQETYSAKKWFKKLKTQEYFEGKAELLDKLLHLSDTVWYFGSEGHKPFEKYKFNEKFDKLFDKYHDCTDMLHDVVDPKSKEEEWNKESDCEFELLNKANDFVKLLIEIRVNEKI